VNHKPGGRLPLLSTRPAVTPATLKRAASKFCCLVHRGTMGLNSLPKTVTRQRGDCDLNPGPSAPESSTLTTRLPSHPTEGSWKHAEQLPPPRGHLLLGSNPNPIYLNRNGAANDTGSSHLCRTARTKLRYTDNINGRRQPTRSHPQTWNIK